MAYLTALMKGSWDRWCRVCDIVIPEIDGTTCQRCGVVYNSKGFRVGCVENRALDGLSCLICNQGRLIVMLVQTNGIKHYVWTCLHCSNNFLKGVLNTGTSFGSIIPISQKEVHDDVPVEQTERSDRPVIQISKCESLAIEAPKVQEHLLPVCHVVPDDWEHVSNDDTVDVIDDEYCLL